MEDVREPTPQEWLAFIQGELTDTKEAVESLELQADCIPNLLEQIAESLERVSFDEVSLNAIKALAEAANNLTEALKEVNTIRAEGDGKAPVKIWAKGGVEIINPIMAPPKKQPKPKLETKESTPDRIKQTFDKRRE